MKIINKILVAIDGSKSAINAANYAVKLSKELKSELEIIYIIKHSIGNIDAGILPNEIEEKEKLRAIQIIDIIKKEYKNIKIQDFETLGQPKKEIIKTFTKWNADLLVIGYHAHSFFEKILGKSVQNKLLKHLKFPILIVPYKIDNVK